MAGPYDKVTKFNDKKTNGSDPCYILLVQDYVSGFTAARPLHDVKAKTVANAIHGVFCEHGSPSVVLSDHDRTSLTSRQVRRVLQRHGTKHYVLPGYGQYLSFWERSHKDMADVVKAIREAYKTTPRGWANVSPAELHYVYKSRLPGDQEGLTDVVDWESLRLKHTDVDTIKVLRDTIPMVDAIKQRTAVTLNDYLDYWRLKQERLLDRYARDREGAYTPKIYDIVFTTKAGDLRVGGHLETSWSGPSTVTKLRVGDVTNNDEETEVYVPVEYGEPETYPLANVHYATGLHDVIHNYYAKGTRVFVDSDGSIRSIPVDSDNDLDLIRRQRYTTAMEKADWPPPRSEGEEGDVLDDDSATNNNDDNQQDDYGGSQRGSMIPQDASVVDDGRNSRRLIEYSTGKGDIGPMVGNGSTSTPLRNVGNHHANDTVDSTAVDVEGICEDEEASPEEEEDDHHQDVFMTPLARRLAAMLSRLQCQGGGQRRVKQRQEGVEEDPP
ncbi:hypothetical protein FOZ60_016044 [Perkinsus olseni]|uniref:Integrase catalytic domain-containing protein n=1 Tax=Perkinsus olseni TaxID=32597 RepID=A0A7J6N5P3_PEROL|nr:hypothetical protein FOZ60_016044 [Perkinsus olseni]